MNILFYTTYRVSATKGGVESTTISVANGLKKKYGCQCYSAYHIESNGPKEKCFESEYHWSNNWCRKGFQKYCISNKIDVIINQGEFSVTKQIKIIAEEMGCKVFFAHHFSPGWEYNFNTLHDILSEFREAGMTRRLKLLIKIAILPYLRLRQTLLLETQYRKAYCYSDMIILLSNGFIQKYKEFGRLNNTDKFIVIPNSLPFDTYYDLSQISNKKPIVLIVSRLEEKPKRISLALQIWKEIKQHEESSDWKLIIIGHGGDKQLYQKMVETQRIPDVQFMGRQQPKPYYEESSLLLMTSNCEGLPMTLLEAKQFGVVPISFNSFVSIWDIVINEENGIVVPECDVSVYESKLLQLMTKRDMRESLAVNAIRDSIRFSQDNIMSMWWEALNK